MTGAALFNALEGNLNLTSSVILAMSPVRNAVEVNLMNVLAVLKVRRSLFSSHLFSVNCAAICRE